jgi:hypothetical protein
MRLFAVTVAASEHIYARIVAPSSLPKTDSAGSGIGSHSWVARHPTRFPSLLAGIRRKPSPPLTWPDDALATGGGQCCTGANETQTEPEPGRHQGSRIPATPWQTAPGRGRPAGQRRGDLAGAQPRGRYRVTAAASGIPGATRCWPACVQAKRYTSRHVGRPDSRAVAGAPRAPRPAAECSSPRLV